ncbi:HNH endonuclease [Rhizobium phage RHph_N34]|uniref:Putative homing endonuclease protein n=1 Tax=Rhizobium phage RHph_N34 TaxID=2509586 RepID=A0A7S5RJS1_9CAUD|nr:HNH endonuclease [Rhizobium phage RHph_N34]QIG73799.1 putative homing endonuclease protein [Rhizobium phage RHph_N34]
MSSSNLFWSKRADKLKLACVYVITYSGDDMPPFYVGSKYTSALVEENYHGSVASSEWAEKWHRTVKEHPERFRRKILHTFDTRKEADDFERKFLVHFDAKRHPLFVNLTNNHGNFCWPKGKKRGPMTEEQKISRSGWKHSEEWKKSHSEWQKSNKTGAFKSGPRLFRRKKFRLKGPQGVQEFLGVSDCSKRINLGRSSIAKLLSGERTEINGWSLG